MNHRLFICVMVWALAGLACQGLTPASESTPVVTVAPVATPTLAPTPAANPNPPPTGNSTVATPTGAAGASGGPSSVQVTPTAPPTASAETGAGESGEAGGDGGSSGNNSSSGSGSLAACPAPGQNLLANPGFEGAYSPFGGIVELNTAAQWLPWWADGGGNFRPEYKPVGVDQFANRVHEGSTAQQYFKSFGQFKAGLYQVVPDVAAGTRLQFSAWGQAWSCENFDQCPNATSVNPANMLMRVGLDPFGDTDYQSDDITWSAYFNPLDYWQLACVEETAQATKVTVFVWASPDGPRQNQDVYWDDARLVIVP